MVESIFKGIGRQMLFLYCLFQLFCLLYTQKKIRKQLNMSFSFVKEAFPMLISGCISAIAAFYCYNAFITAMSAIPAVIFSCMTGLLLYLLVLFIADSGELMRIIRSFRSKKCVGDL